MAAVSVHAAQLKVVKVNAPAINYLFSSNRTVTVNDVVASFVTDLPPSTVNPTNPPLTQTNLAFSGFLQSRSYQGQPGTPEAGLTAYEYRLVLQHLQAATGVPMGSRDIFVSINSMTLNFSPYSSFNYKSQTSNQGMGCDQRRTGQY